MRLRTPLVATILSLPLAATMTPDASAQAPKEEFNYDEFVKEEFGAGSPRAIKPLWGIVAVVLLAALIAGMCFTLF